MRPETFVTPSGDSIKAIELAAIPGLGRGMLLIVENHPELAERYETAEELCEDARQELLNRGIKFPLTNPKDQPLIELAAPLDFGAA